MKLLKPGFIFLIIMYLIKVDAQDVSGSSDHPLLNRIPTAKIIHYFQRDYDEMQFVKDYSEVGKMDWIKATGKHTSIVYDVGDSKSPLEVAQIIKQQLIDQKANIIYTCNGKACDFGKPGYSMEFFRKLYYKEGNRSAESDHYLSFQSGSERQQYLLVNLPYNGKQTFVEIAAMDHYTGRTYALVEILETNQPMVTQKGQISILILSDDDEKSKFHNNPQDYLDRWQEQKMISALAYQNGSLDCEQLYSGIPILFSAQIKQQDEVLYESKGIEHFLYLGQKILLNENLLFPENLFSELPEGQLQITFLLTIPDNSIPTPKPFILNFKN